MKCNKCEASGIMPIQESKTDYWLCSKCGDYHQRFPYTCPITKYKAKVKEVITAYLCRYTCRQDDKIRKLRDGILKELGL